MYRAPAGAILKAPAARLTDASSERSYRSAWGGLGGVLGLFRSTTEMARESAVSSLVAGAIQLNDLWAELSAVSPQMVSNWTSVRLMCYVCVVRLTNAIWTGLAK